MKTQQQKRPPSRLDDETQAKFDDLEKVEDLRPFWRGRPNNDTPSPIDTPDLISTGETSVAAAREARKQARLQRKVEKLIKTGEWKMAGTGQKIRKRWNRDGTVWFIMGLAGVLGAGIVTFLLLLLLTR